MKEQDRREERADELEVIELGSVTEETQGGSNGTGEGVFPKP